MGFVFQFYNLIASLTARENVALVTDIASDPMSPDQALALVGLDDRAAVRPVIISGRGRDYARIQGGVSEGERVVLYPSDLISDGTTVSF